MRLNIFKNSELDENRVEIHYKNKNRQVDKIINYIRESSNATIIGVIDDHEIVVSQEQLYYFESIDKKCFAYASDEIYQIKSTLTELEMILEDEMFARVNKSTILNISKVQSIKSDLNMKTVALLYNGEKTIISRHYQKAFKEKLYQLRDRLVESNHEIN